MAHSKTPHNYLLTCFVAWSLFSLLSLLDVFRYINFSFHDYLIHWLPHKNVSSQTIMVTVDRDFAFKNSDQLLNIPKILNQYSPKAIIIPAEFTANLDVDSLQSLYDQPNVTLVKKITRQINKYEQLEFLDHYETPSYINSYWLPVTLESGAYRQWYTKVGVDDSELMSFQRQIATVLGKKDLPDKVFINFSAGPRSIPQIHQDRVLTNDLVHELIQNRVVIVDREVPHDDARFASPFIQNPFGMTGLELQAFAMETALQENALTILPLPYLIIVCALIFLFGTIMLQYLSPISGIFVSLAISCIYIFLAAVILYAFNIITPLSEIILCQLAVVILFFQIRRIQEHQTLEGVLSNLQYSLSKRLSPPNFNLAEDPWVKIVTLINQQLELNRSILLERVTGDHRVREIQALNCSINDIDELRRDYERAPYKEAIANNGVLKLNRQYFKKIEDEDEYLCSLHFGGQVLGFWALTIPHREDFNEQAFANNVNSFATQIANLLYHREQWQQAQSTEQSFWQRFKSFRLGEQKQIKLKQLVTSLEKRVDSLEHVFDGMSTAAVLYDLFGQVIQTNELIDKLAKIGDIPIYQLSALDFLCRISDIDSDSARRELRHVIIKHQTVSLPSIKLSDDTPYILNIRPIKSATPEDGNPFQLLGVLFEFIDASTLKQVLRMKQDIYCQFFHHIRNNLSSLNLISRRLGKIQDLSSDNGVKVLGLVDDNLDKTSKLLDDVEGFLNDSNEINRLNILPIDPLFTIQSETQKHQDAINRKALTLDSDLPNIVSLVFVNPLRFQRLIESSLDLLIDDAVQASALSISLTDLDVDSQRLITITLKNEGYGVDQEKLARSINYMGTDVGKPSYLNEFATQLSFSKYAGIEVGVETDIGRGFEISIRLNGFNLDL